MVDKKRLEYLAKIDALQFEDILPRCQKSTTTSKATYIHHTDADRAAIFSKPKQQDESLISGHYKNNLKVKNLQMITRTWPKAMDWREEYSQFLVRLKLCNPVLYNIFFKCPVQYQHAEQFLKDLYKTIYGIDYSPTAYESLYRQKRVYQTQIKVTDDMKDYQTTYGNYYNRLQDCSIFKDFLYKQPKPKDPNIDSMEDEFRKLFKKYDLSTYFEEICIPALYKAKDGNMPTGYIDRHTLRKN